MKTIKDNSLSLDKTEYPKFRNMQGYLTAYAFGCGYVAECVGDDNHCVTLQKENETYLVRGFMNGEHFSEGSRRLSVARRLYNDRRKQIAQA